jgi:hypothetical protein
MPAVAGFFISDVHLLNYLNDIKLSYHCRRLVEYPCL